MSQPLIRPNAPTPAAGVDIVAELLRMREQFQVLHWQTNSYAEHKAFDWIFDELSSSTDKFMESYLGIYGKGKIKGPFKLVLLDYANVTPIEFAQHCIEIIDKIEEQVEGESDLENIIADMIGAFHKLKYLLTLK